MSTAPPPIRSTPLATAAQRNGADISLTPLIDMVFVLLIFFMLAGTLVAAPPFAIDLPISASGRPAEPAPTLGIAADGRLAWRGALITPEALATRLAVRDLPALIRVEADTEAPADRLIQALADLQASGAKHVALGTLSADRRP